MFHQKVYFAEFILNVKLFAMLIILSLKRVIYVFAQETGLYKWCTTKIYFCALRPTTKYFELFIV